VVTEAVSSLPDDYTSGGPDAEAGNQLSLGDLVKPAEWPGGKNEGPLTIDASCASAEIT
jgi:IS5 family transposase